MRTPPATSSSSSGVHQRIVEPRPSLSIIDRRLAAHARMHAYQIGRVELAVALRQAKQPRCSKSSRTSWKSWRPISSAAPAGAPHRELPRGRCPRRGCPTRSSPTVPRTPREAWTVRIENQCARRLTGDRLSHARSARTSEPLGVGNRRVCRRCRREHEETRPPDRPQLRTELGPLVPQPAVRLLADERDRRGATASMRVSNSARSKSPRRRSPEPGVIR